MSRTCSSNAAPQQGVVQQNATARNSTKHGSKPPGMLRQGPEVSAASKKGATLSNIVCQAGFSTAEGRTPDSARSPRLLTGTRMHLKASCQQWRQAQELLRPKPGSGNSTAPVSRCVPLKVQVLLRAASLQGCAAKLGKIHQLLVGRCVLLSKHVRTHKVGWWSGNIISGLVSARDCLQTLSPKPVPVSLPHATILTQLLLPLQCALMLPDPAFGRQSSPRPTAHARHRLLPGCSRQCCLAVPTGTSPETAKGLVANSPHTNLLISRL